MSTWGRRWGREKVIRRRMLLELVWDFLILYCFSPSFLFLLSLFHTRTQIQSSIFSPLPTPFLIIACLLTLVILVSHLWWCPRVLGHFVCVWVLVVSEHRSEICYRVLVGVEGPLSALNRTCVWIYESYYEGSDKWAKTGKGKMDIKCEWQTMYGHRPHHKICLLVQMLKNVCVSTFSWLCSLCTKGHIVWCTYIKIKCVQAEHKEKWPPALLTWVWLLVCLLRLLSATATTVQMSL